MKFKPAKWAVVAAPFLFLLLLAGGVRGLTYLQGGASSETDSAPPKPEGRLPSEGFPPPPAFHSADAQTQADVEKVVGGQIAALQKRDYEAALRFAQPGFQKGWKPEAFGQMIENGYAELVSAKTVSFQPARIGKEGVIALVSLVVRDAQKRETRFLYILNRDTAAKDEKKNGDNDGGKDAALSSDWHVSSCQRDSLLPAPPRVLHEM